MLNKPMLLNTVQKAESDADTFDVVDYGGFLCYGVNVVKALETDSEFKPYCVVQAIFDSGAIGDAYIYYAHMSIPNINELEHKDYFADINLCDPFCRFRQVSADMNSPLYDEFQAIREVLLSVFNFEYNTISPSEGYISDDGSTFYSIVENNAVALDTDSVISSLKHSYPWGSPFQIHIDGEQYWENTYRLIDEHLAVVGGGGGGNLLRILRIAPSNHSFFEEAA